MNIVKYQNHQIEKLNIPIHFNKELSLDEIKSLDCDNLIFAVGTEATLPVKLKDLPNVLTQDEAILKSKHMGKNVVVWGLDTYWKGGAETAITLNEQGYNIKAIAGSERTLAGILTNANLTGRVTFIHRYFKKKNIPIFNKAELLDIAENSLTILDIDKNEHVIEADTLVYCGARTTPKNTLEEELKDVKFKVDFIGDCNKPKDIQAAIKDAQTIARSI
jgi:pyruvate/2-oxoglutarate dehydrogenase complex dihydrolipoamide dehydrogenase (E3) component